MIYTNIVICIIVSLSLWQYCYLYDSIVIFMDRDHLINTITIINQMRGSASKQKSVTRDKQAQIAKESDDIMKKI